MPAVRDYGARIMLQTTKSPWGATKVLHISRARFHAEGGRLVSCLTDWIVPEDSLYRYYSTRRFMSSGLCAVIDELKVPSS